MNIQQFIVYIVLVLAGSAVALIALFHYVFAGWSAKRKDIMDGFDVDARLAYFEMFGRSTPAVSTANAVAAFEQFHSKWYGRRYFVVPSIVFCVLVLAGVAAVTSTGLDRLRFLVNPLIKLPDTAMAALAGAYLWVANDLISRARRLDFSPSDVIWASLRLSIAVPMGYAFAVVAAKSVGPFVAFGLGTFPLVELTAMLRRLTNKTLGLEAAASETTDDIIKLQGINRAIVDRLSVEDINTITQIAYCDPVRLIMRSNLTFNFVTDCMNQALAWMYLQSDLDVIRPLGMRGALEIRYLVRELDDTTSTDPVLQAAHGRAVAALPIIAAAIKQDPATLQIVFRQIAEDPYAVFLERVWT